MLEEGSRMLEVYMGITAEGFEYQMICCLYKSWQLPVFIFKPIFHCIFVIL